MAPLSEPLIPGALQTGAVRATLRQTFSVAIALSATALLLLAVPRGFNPLALYSGQLPDSETTGDDRHWLQCVLNTGGTCNMWRCHEDRGPTECRWFIFGYHCMCQQGYCSGVDGKCSPNPNRLVAQSIRLKNAQWPDFYLYLSLGNSLGLTADRTDTRTKWNLLELPTAQEPPMQLRRFLLGSVRDPSYVATTRASEQCDTCRVGHSDEPCNCRPQWSASGRLVMKMSSDLPIHLTPVPWEEPAFLISSIQWPSLTWMAMTLSYYVATVYGDPGPQGYWIPEPPLNVSSIL